MISELPAFPWLNPEPAPAPTVRLKRIFLHLTKACNLHCAYCYFSASRPLPDEMTSEEYRRLWPDMVALRPHKVIFTGGEPLLRPDLLDLLAGLREADPGHQVLRCLNSNGYLVTTALAEALVGLADEVRVSIDGLQERNDTLRGVGSFEAALRALETYQEVGFEPKALVTVTASSLPDLTDLLCLLIDRGITRINLNSFRPIGRGRGHPDWGVKPSDVTAAVRSAWLRCYPDAPPPPENPATAACANCGVGSFLNIMPNGDVFPCHVLTEGPFHCGNLCRQSLLEICRREGPLGHLQALDFHAMARREVRLLPLTQPDTCMGNVYATTKSLPAWDDCLPPRPVAPGVPSS